MGESFVYSPAGDIVAAVAEDIRRELKDAIQQGAMKLTLDLERVEIIDSIGLGLIIAVHNTISKAGGSLVVANASKDQLDLFRSMRLDHHFTILGRQDESRS